MDLSSPDVVVVSERRRPPQFNLFHREGIKPQIAWDAHKRRLARWTSDTVISIWDRDLRDGKFKKTTQWRVHGGDVQRIAWAHPEFGSLFTVATNSKVQVFVEFKRRTPAGELETCWARRACITDSEVDIADMAFAPRRLGLVLATLSVEGEVRIYDGTDGIDRTRWSLCYIDEALDAKCGTICWSQSRIHQPLLAVAANDEHAQNKERIVIYEFDRLSQLNRIVSLRFDLAAPVTDMKFSPRAIAHSHQLAVAAGAIHLYNIKIPNPESVNNNIVTMEDGAQRSPTDTAYSATLIAIFEGITQSLRFNAVGTILVADSGSSGIIRAWKATLGNMWKIMDNWDDEDLEDWEMPKEIHKEKIIFDHYHC